MNYGFKPTTNGRNVLTACASLSKPLILTRVAVGSGTVGEEINLADVHELLCYEAEGAITERRHEGDRLYLTIQYRNEATEESFYLSEFMIFCKDPETGKETDLIYATLGDYKQGIPAYDPGFPTSVWNFPLIVVISDEIEVLVSASPGLITAEEFAVALTQQKTGFIAALAAHNADPSAHNHFCRVLAVREREAGKPDYGLGEETPVEPVLLLSAYTGDAPVAAVVSGTQYDARNMSVGEDAPDGTLILREARA